MQSGHEQAQQLVHQLTQLQASGIALCKRSSAVLHCDDQAMASAYMQTHTADALIDTPHTTCLTSIAVSAGSSAASASESTVAVGAEDGTVHLIDGAALAVATSWDVGGAPVAMVSTGTQSSPIAFMLHARSFAWILR